MLVYQRVICVHLFIPKKHPVPFFSRPTWPSYLPRHWLLALVLSGRTDEGDVCEGFLSLRPTHIRILLEWSEKWGENRLKHYKSPFLMGKSTINHHFLKKWRVNSPPVTGCQYRLILKLVLILPSKKKQPKQPQFCCLYQDCPNTH